MAQIECFSCHKKFDVAERVSIREVCPHCDADAHVCKNCTFYDPKVYNECREPQADRIQVKDRANRCDYFQPRAEGTGGTAVDKAKALKDAAEALFKKK